MAHRTRPGSSGGPDDPAFWEHLDHPPSATVQVVFGAQSLPGRTRAVNQDHYAVIELGRYQETVLTNLPDATFPEHFDEAGYAMVVADGHGDAGSGEVVSRMAVSALMHLVLHFGKWNLRVDAPAAQQIMQRAERFYRYIHAAAVTGQANANPARAQTTLTAVFGAGRDLFFAHVGHSRAYLLRDGTLMRLTRDHTINARQQSPHRPAPLINVNAMARDLRHTLTDMIGNNGVAGPKIDLERLQVLDGDRVLVCSNGLTDAVPEFTISKVLGSSQSPHEQSRALVNEAISVQAGDDATAVIAHYRMPN